MRYVILICGTYVPIRKGSPNWGSSTRERSLLTPFNRKSDDTWLTSSAEILSNKSDAATAIEILLVCARIIWPWLCHSSQTTGRWHAAGEGLQLRGRRDFSRGPPRRAAVFSTRARFSGRRTTREKPSPSLASVWRDNGASRARAHESAVERGSRDLSRRHHRAKRKIERERKTRSRRTIESSSKEGRGRFIERWMLLTASGGRKRDGRKSQMTIAWHRTQLGSFGRLGRFALRSTRSDHRPPRRRRFQSCRVCMECIRSRTFMTARDWRAIGQSARTAP